MAEPIDSVNRVITTLEGWAKGSKEPVPTVCRQHIEALRAVIEEIKRGIHIDAPLYRTLEGSWNL